MIDLKQKTERLLADGDAMIHCHSYTDIGNHIRALQAEVDRLTAALKQANVQAEHFEREWYLRGDQIERLQAECEAVQALANDAYAAWDSDKDSRVGKLLMAMRNPEFRASYRPDLAAMNRERGG